MSVREKDMARVPCNLHLLQWALAVVTRAVFSSVPGWCKIKKILKLSFLVTRVLLGVKSRSSGLRTKARDFSCFAFSLIFLCFCFALGFFGFGLGLVFSVVFVP